MQGIALLGAFLRLTPFRERSGLTEDQLFEALDRVLNKYFGKQGPNVIAENLAVARQGYREVTEVRPPAGENASENSHELPWHWESGACARDGCLVWKSLNVAVKFIERLALESLLRLLFFHGLALFL
jgi:hypothetical protein